MTKLTSRTLRFAALMLVVSMFLPLAARSAQASWYPTTTKALPWKSPTPWGATIGFDVHVDKGNVNIPLTGNLCVFIFQKNVLPQPTCAKPDSGGWAGIGVPNNLPRGNYAVRAIYTGDYFYNESESNFNLTVGPNLPTVMIDDNNCPVTISKSGQAALWVDVKPSKAWLTLPNLHPTGQIVLYDGNQWAGAATLQASNVQYAHSIAWFSLNSYANIGILKLGVGVHQLTATYVSDDDNYWSGQSTVCQITVTP